MFNFHGIQRGVGKQTFVKSDAVLSNQVLEGRKNFYTHNQNQVLAMSNNNFPMDLDLSWFPAAAETYQISPNIQDYLIVDVPAVTIDVPNRNLQAFPFEEVSYFDPKHGKQIYGTFVGKPSCKDHENDVQEDMNRAKGVIFGSILQYVPEYGLWKIRLLQGYDRTKDARLTQEIEAKIRKYYSMGALVRVFLCPICGTIETKTKKCPCIKGNVQAAPIVNGFLKYSLCCDIVYIENSSVIEPADVSAEGLLF